MAITGPTLLDVVETTVSAATIVLTVPAGGVPADALLVVDAQIRSGGPTVDSCADDGGNTYEQDNATGTSDSNRFTTIVTTALSSADNITVTLSASSDRRVAAAYYFEGVGSAIPSIDESENDPARPSANFPGGYLALGRVRGVGASAAVTEDANFTTVNSPAPSLEVGAAPRIVANSAHQVVSTGGTVEYDPTLTDFVGTTSITLQGFAPAGAGNLPLLNHYYQ